jgi:hypothetical protein
MKIALFITLVTYLLLSYSQADDKRAVALSYDHHKMLAAQACPSATTSRKQQNENWIYLKGGSANINMMMLDWHNAGGERI